MCICKTWRLTTSSKEGVGVGQSCCFFYTKYSNRKMKISVISGRTSSIYLNVLSHFVPLEHDQKSVQWFICTSVKSPSLWCLCSFWGKAPCFSHCPIIPVGQASKSGVMASPLTSPTVRLGRDAWTDVLLSSFDHLWVFSIRALRFLDSSPQAVESSTQNVLNI